MKGARRAAWAGMGLVAVHAALLGLLLTHCRRAPLRVHAHLDPAGAMPGQDLIVALPEDLAGRVHVRLDGRDLGPWTGPAMLAGALAPGMHHIEWLVRYRGGFERRVGMTRLVGPFQDPAAPPCAVRLIVGQRFLDDGAAGPGTLAHEVARRVRHQLRDFERWPLGRLHEVRDLRLAWMRIDDLHDGKRARAVRRAAGRAPQGGASHAEGFLQVSLTLRFEDGAVPVWAAVVPRITDRGLDMGSYAEATVALDNRFFQWISDLLDGDDKASAIVRRELDGALAQGLGLLPPLSLPGGGALAFSYCRDRPVEVATGRFAAVWLALAPVSGASMPAVPPVLLGPAAPRDLADLEAPLAVELELDAVNGVLHALWQAGVLDQALARAGAVEGFNQDPLVMRLLSVRIGDLRLTLPPAAWQEPGRDLRLGMEAALRIHDQGRDTPARVFGTVGLRFDEGSPGAGLALAPGQLALTCEPEPGVLEPCYGDLVQAWAQRADHVLGALTRRFAALLDELVLGRRVGMRGMSAGFAIERIRVHAVPAPPTGTLRVDLFGLFGQRERPPAGR